MPPKKRTKAASSADDDNEESDGYMSDSASSVDSTMEVQVDFEARVIDETDFHGIRRLLQQAFLKAPIDLSGLTDLLIRQSRHVGSVLKVADEGSDSEDCHSEQKEDEEEEGKEVYGVTSVIGLSSNKDKACVRQLQDWLLSQCKTHSGENIPQLTALLSNDSKPAAFLINERFLNIPVDIAPLLLQTLIGEVKEAEKRHPDQFNIHYYVLIGRSHLVNLPKPKTGKKRKTKAKAATKEGAGISGAEGEPVFDFYENELIHKASILSFSYPVGEESDQVLGGKWDMDDNAMKPYRTLMVIEARKLERCIVELEQAIRSN